ncbi:MAG: clostripain-related cysteine peptidase, partial [Pirellulales bacterium]|nr:clostripain-related cysteine peptidase [Pirellulales bacterium]
PAGEYYVKVYGYAGATNTYELQFNINTSSVTPDRFEVNDTLQTATQLRELSGFTMYEELGFHSSNDEDWFAFETVAASNQSNYVSALDHGENGGINLELFDSSGNSIAQDGEFLQFDNLPASQYYLRVTPSYQDQHTYDLVIDAPVLSQSPGDPNRGDWTIMVYITASDLYHFAQSDVNEIEKAVSELPGTVNVTVLWDQSEFGMTYATDSGRQAPWGGAGQAVITPDSDMASIRTHFDLLGEKNTGDPSTLVDFVTWSKGISPADKYGLILWDHGAGLDGFNYDNLDPGPSDYLTTQELATAMTGLSQNGPAVDLLSFDACLMSMAEVGYELRNVTDVFVSSQELVGGDGHNYKTLFDTLKQNPGSVTAEELGVGFVRSFNDFYAGTLWDTHSAIRTSGFESLTNALGQLTTAVSNADHDSQRIVSSTIGHTHSFGYEDLRDLGSFVERLANHNTVSPTIRNAAATVLDTLQSMVISRTADQRDSSGLSIFLPAGNQTTHNWYGTDYASFNAATNWNSMLSTLRSSGNTNYTQADWLQGGRSALTAFDLGVVAGAGNSFSNLSLFDSQDSDWMKFEVRGGGTTAGDFGISVNSNSDSTLSAVLYDAAGTTVGSLLDGRLKIESFEDGIYTLHVSATGEVSDYEVTIDTPNLTTFRGRVVGNNDTAEKATDWGVINGAQIEPGLTLPSRSFGSDNDGWKYFEFQAPRLPGITDWSLSVNTPQNTSVTAELLQKGTDSLVEMATETGSGSLPFSYTSFGESEQYVIRVRQSQS